MRIRNPESFDPGSGMKKFGSGISDKNLGSATLEFTKHYRSGSEIRKPRKYPCVLFTMRFNAKYVYIDIRSGLKINLRDE
jgi:hypothetical protein